MIGSLLVVATIASVDDWIAATRCSLAGAAFGWRSPGCGWRVSFSRARRARVAVAGLTRVATLVCSPGKWRPISQ